MLIIKIDKSIQSFFKLCYRLHPVIENGHPRYLEHPLLNIESSVNSKLLEDPQHYKVRLEIIVLGRIVHHNIIVLNETSLSESSIYTKCPYIEACISCIVIFRRDVVFDFYFSASSRGSSRASSRESSGVSIDSSVKSSVKWSVN